MRSDLFRTNNVDKNVFPQQHDDITDLRNKLAATEDIHIKRNLNLRLATQYLIRPES
jgi:hypothetical protein